MNLRTALPIIVALLLAAPLARADRPNIVLIYADDVGYGDIGVYGATKIPTPHIDRLAAGGLRFTDAYCTAATCTPSRYSLLTGEYAFRKPDARILRGDAAMIIQPGTPTLASVLQQAGYATACIGKWHLGLGDGDIDWNGEIKPGPMEVGFDVSFVIAATNDRVPCVYVEGHRVYGLSDQDEPIRVSYGERIGDLPTGHDHPQLLRYGADPQHSGTIINRISRIGYMSGGDSAWWKDEDMALIFADRSERFIEQNKEAPFFLFLSMHENHVPRAPHPQFVGRSDTGLRGDTVVELDWVVGRVVQALDQRGLREDTLIIFTSDNGPIFFDGYFDGSVATAGDHRPSGPFRGGKYQAFEGGTRMPFIVNWPAKVQAGGVSNAIISQVDLLATLAALVEAELPDDAGPDSLDLLPALLGSSTQGREHVVQQGVGTLAIRKGPWKYIPSGQRASAAMQKHAMGPTALSTPALDNRPYLFHLDDDPGETNDLSEQHPKIAKELAALLQQVRSTPSRRSWGDS